MRLSPGDETRRRTPGLESPIRVENWVPARAMPGTPWPGRDGGSDPKTLVPCEQAPERAGLKSGPRVLTASHGPVPPRLLGLWGTHGQREEEACSAVGTG